MTGGVKLKTMIEKYVKLKHLDGQNIGD